MDILPISIDLIHLLKLATSIWQQFNVSGGYWEGLGGIVWLHCEVLSTQTDTRMHCSAHALIRACSYCCISQSDLNTHTLRYQLIQQVLYFCCVFPDVKRWLFPSSVTIIWAGKGVDTQRVVFLPERVCLSQSFHCYQYNTGPDAGLSQNTCFTL